MRYSRMEGNSGRENSGGKGGFLIVFVICVAAAVYFIGAAKVGSFLSDNIITPVMAFITGQETTGSEPSASASSGDEDETVTDELEMSGLTLYALQAGVFDSEANAQELADTLREQGGAGYIRASDDYRVYVSAYETEEEADNVKERLESEESLSCKVREITSEKLSMKITAPAAAVESAKTALTLAGQLEGKLCELSLSLDKSEISASKALESITELSDYVESAKVKFDESTAGADSPVYKAISEYLGGVAKLVDNLLKDDTAAKLSPELKYAYLDAAFMRYDLAAAINENV